MEEDGLSEIQRLDEQDNTIYIHRYHSNELEELPFDLGTIEHRCFERKYVQTSPYGIERGIWDDKANLIEHEYNNETYKPIYDEVGSLPSEFPLAEGVYDDEGKLIQKGDLSYKYNDKDQLIEVVSKTIKAQLNYKKQTPSNMNQQVKRGKAPKSIYRVDQGKVEFEKDHVTFKDETALNYDGTWKHGIRQLTNKEKKWILKNGWKLPPS